MQKLACIKSIDAVMLITQYGISASAVSEEINADHMPRLPWHGRHLFDACVLCLGGQPVDPQIIRGKFWGNVENIRMKPKHFFVCGFGFLMNYCSLIFFVLEAGN